MVGKTTPNSTEVNLAVYMERLDSYIASQTALNKTLTTSIEGINERLDEISDWRNRVYGAKAVMMGIGILIVHTSAVMGSFFALMSFYNK
tara:strand:- start:2793 stop:3062 length:270 start_codon:yes stop_codon:yes gene_type:complete